jgi:plasmid stability protein
MKNITLSIDDDVLDRVRIVAATRKTSVNALVREHLVRLAMDEDRLAAAKQELRALSETAAVDLGANYRFNREEIYADRDVPRHQHPDLRSDREAK